MELGGFGLALEAAGLRWKELSTLTFIFTQPFRSLPE